MEYIENDIVKIYLEGGILFASYQPDLRIDLEIAKKTVEHRLAVSNGVSRPLLADVRNLKYVENDAREYLASKEASQYVKALAVLTDTPIQNLFANFFMKVNKPPMPTHLFTNEGKAIRWLQLHFQTN